MRLYLVTPSILEMQKLSPRKRDWPLLFFFLIHAFHWSIIDLQCFWCTTRWFSYIYIWTVVLERALESPLDCQEIQPVHPKGDQSWIFIGRTDAEAEASILWPPNVKNWLIGKDPDSGKDWRQEEKGTTEDEMVRWHHQLNGHKFEQALEVGDEQGSLACCSPWCHKELDMTEWLNWTDWLKEHYMYREKVEKSNLWCVTWLI